MSAKNLLPLALRLAMASLFIASASIARADAYTDGSVGPATHLSGEMRIGAELGTMRGANLYHSFQTFDVNTGESATFTGPNSIQHVISRVTGGKNSYIDGALRSEVGQADVYLINPAGVVMGPNAMVDVPGAFHVSTADELRFADGKVYSASDPGRSTLTMASPEAFGFLASRPASITLDGAQLALNPGQNATLTAGNIDINGTPEQPAVIFAESGNIRLEAVGNTESSVLISQPSDSPGTGQLKLDYAQIDTSGDGGGSIALRAGHATLSDSWLIAENQGPTDASGGIDLRLQELLQLNRTYVYADTAASGAAGNVGVRAGELRMAESTISSDTYENPDLPFSDFGSAGRVSIEIFGLLAIRAGAQIHSDTYTSSHAGSVEIKAGSVWMDSDGILDRFTGIESQTFASGNAGLVKLQVGGLLEILNGAQISSSTWAEGDAGTIDIESGTIRMDGLNSYDTGIYSQTLLDTSGNAGSIKLQADNDLEVLNANISSQSYGSGDSGDIDILTNNLHVLGRSILISGAYFNSGDSGSISIKSSRILVDGGSVPDINDYIASISSYAESGSGKSGTITIDSTEDLELRNGGFISTASNSGDAGAITIRVGKLMIDGKNRRTPISSRAFEEATGYVGRIDIVADQMMIRDGGEITIATLQKLSAGATSAPDSQINIAANQLELDNGLITAQSQGNVSAAAIHITAGEALFENGSRITTESQAADAGPILIGGGLLWLTDSLITTSAEGSTGNGGDITLTPEYLILDGGFIQANTAAQRARGGDIFVDTRALIASQGLLEIGGATRQDFATNSGRNIIQAAAPGGEQGTISVTSPDLDITAALTPLAAPFSDPDELFTNLCRTLNETESSSLIERGQGGLPIAPDVPASIPFTTERLDRLHTASPGAME